MTSAVRPAGPAISRDTLLGQARSLPATPQLLAGLGELLQDANIDLATIAAEIRLEPTLAARVIRMSNSAAFGGGQRVGSVDEAVSRVGFGEVLGLVGAATVEGLVDRSLGGYGISTEELRESLLLHALASEALAGGTEIDSRTAYSAGLLRGIGMIVLDRAGRANVTAADVYDRTHFATYAEWEIEKFGITSMEVTTMVIEEWRFPADVVTAVRGHFMRDGVDGADRFACLLNLAGGIVAANGLALAGETHCWAQSAEKLSLLGISEVQFLAASATSMARFERQRNALY